LGGIRRVLVVGATAAFALVLVGAAPTASSEPPQGQVFSVPYRDARGTGVAFGFNFYGRGPSVAKATITSRRATPWISGASR